MIYNVQGKLVDKSQITKSISKNGNEWKRQKFVVDVQDGRYISRVSIDARDEKTELLARIPVGSEVKVAFTISAREYNGSWYNDVTAVGIDKVEAEVEVNDLAALDQAPMSGEALADMPE